MVAYYCFVNLGWPPSRYDELPLREKLLVNAFVLKECESRRERMKKVT